MYIPIQDTVTCEQTNRRPDVIRPIVYKDEERDQTQDRTLGTQDNTGAGSEAYSSKSYFGAFCNTFDLH